MRPSSCGLATMESYDGALCRTGRVVEADIDLCGEPGGISRARGRSRFRARGDRYVREIESTRSGTDRPGDRTDSHMAVDRAQATWPAGDLHRRAPRQGGTQDADQ